ncbi:MAG TPA: hypothetical protein VFS93_07325 [Terrimesophilobacter sp.]|nr:hypothetical protein [Terrimesophilobacter sp.]
MSTSYRTAGVALGAILASATDLAGTLVSVPAGVAGRGIAPGAAPYHHRLLS